MAIVETIDGRVVTDYTLLLRRHVQHVHRRAGVERGQCLREIALRTLRRLHQRPVAAQATQDPRLRRSHDLRQCEALRIDRLVVGNFGDGFAHALAVHFMWPARSVRLHAQWRKPVAGTASFPADAT